MMTRSEKVRLGVFLIVSVTVLVGTFAALAGIELMESHDIYEVRFDESVSGLEIGAQVKYNGVRVGQVSDIVIDRKNVNKVTVLLELREGTPIKENTRAVLVGVGITGLKFVELTGGTSDAELLEPGSSIEAGQSFMGSIEGKAEDIALKTEAALNKINAVLTRENVVRVGSILEKVESLAGRVDGIVEKNEDKVGSIITDMEKASGELEQGVASARRSAEEIEQILGESRPKVQTILDNVDATTNTIRSTARDLAKVDGILKQIKGTLEEFNRQLDQADVGGLVAESRAAVGETEATVKSIRRIVESSRENIYSSSVSLRNTLRNLEEVSAQLRDQPSLLLESEPPPERTPPDEDRRRKER